MTSYERLRTVLDGGVPDRVPYYEDYWRTTVERWKGEGMPDVSPHEYFGTEMTRLAGDYTLRFPVTEIEQTDRYRIYTDENGAKRKDLLAADGWTPGWMDFTVRNREDWAKTKPRAAYAPDRIGAHIKDAHDCGRKAEKLLVYSGHACFHPTWQKVGMEQLMVWMIEDPELVHDLFETHTTLMIDLLKGMLSQGVTFDAAWFHDDLGYRNAPLISPAMYRELVFPHHKRLCDAMAEEGLKTIFHSDGNVEPLIPDFLEAGFVALNPLETKAGLDVRILKPKYGDRLVLFGGIDVRELAKDLEAIEAEVKAKLEAGMPGGGYIWHSDHSVPNDVSFENYEFAMEMLGKYGRYG